MNTENLNLQLFLCHSNSNKPLVYELYHRLREDGFNPWLDKESIVVGSDWNKAIESGLYKADMALLCFSQDFIQKALNPEEYIAKEVEIAKELAREISNGRNFIIPVRLERCRPPEELGFLEAQWVNFYQAEDYERLIKALRLKQKQKSYVTELLKNDPNPIKLVGRENDLDTISQFFNQKNVGARVVSLTGPGGTGKTRLSIAAASFLVQDFTDGVFFIDLSEIKDPTKVIPTIGSKIIPATEVAGENDFERLTTFLQNKKILLVLDNFEQVMEARLDIAKLLKVVQSLKIIITSREKLNITGEQGYPVAPLNIQNLKTILTKKHLLQEDFEVILQSPPVDLFNKRAQMDNSSFKIDSNNARAITEICLRLEGMPLAIVLVAARVSSKSYQQILKSLKTLLKRGELDRPKRHQSLQAVFDWSYDLLLESEKQLFAQLAIFAGNFTEEAVESICDGADDSDLLDALLDKSLLRVSEANETMWFSMLDTIRQFAYEKLVEPELSILKAKHARYYLQKVKKIEPELNSSDQAIHLKELDLNSDNIRAVLNWATEPELTLEKIEIGLSLSSALWKFWLVKGRLAEGQEWLNAFFTAAKPFSNSIPAKVLMQAYKAAGVLAANRGDFSEARSKFEQSLEIARKLGDKVTIASLLNNLGSITGEQKDYLVSQTYFSESLKLFNELGNKQAIGQLLNNLGLIAHYLDDNESARGYLEESLKVRRQLKDRLGIANTCSTLGDVVLDQGDYAAAQKFLTESLDLYEKLGDPKAIAQLLEFFGGLATASNDYERAIKLFAAASAIREEIGAMPSQAENSVNERRLAPARDSLNSLAYQALWEKGYNLELQQAIDFALER